MEFRYMHAHRIYSAMLLCPLGDNHQMINDTYEGLMTSKGRVFADSTLVLLRLFRRLCDHHAITLHTTRSFERWQKTDCLCSHIPGTSPV